MAKTREQIISEATLRARRDFLAFNRQAEQEILNIFINARLNLLRRIQFGVRADTFMKARRLALLEQVDKQIAAVRIQLNSRIQAQMRNSIDLGLSTAIKGMEPTDVTAKINVGTSFIGKDGVVRRFNPADEVFAASQWAQINTQAMDFMIRVRPTGNTFAQSVWGTTQHVQTRIRTMLNRAILLGDSSQRLARDITAYMSKEGIRLPSGQRRSAYKAAWRLARTEMNRAYTEGQVRYAKSKTWIDGVIWRRGGPGPCSTGQCPAGANRFYPKDQAPQLPAHPNCLCYFVQHIVGDDLPEGVDKGPKPPERPIPTPPSRKDAEKVPTSGTPE
jgi:hypothetical protein